MLDCKRLKDRDQGPGTRDWGSGRFMGADVKAGLGYNLFEAVELLSNLAWAAVVIVLWGAWLGGRRCRGGRSLLPATAAQLVALAMLSATLLVVISVTDDLQASQSPAEVVRVCTSSDRHFSAGQPTHRPPAALAMLAFFATSTRLRTVGFLTADESYPHREITHFRVLWSRPPPSA